MNYTEQKNEILITNIIYAISKFEWQITFNKIETNSNINSVIHIIGIDCIWFPVLYIIKYSGCVFYKKQTSYSKLYLHNKAAAFVSWALGWLTAACSEGVVMAANAARFWMFIGGRRPAAAAAADSVWALKPGKYMSDGVQDFGWWYGCNGQVMYSSEYSVCVIKEIEEWGGDKRTMRNIEA